MVDDVERLKQCYRTINEFIREEHSEEVGYSHSCSASLSISASILACKLFDSGWGNSSGNESEEGKPSRTDLLDLEKGAESI